jgi:DNA repair protein RadA/Sms
MSNIKTIFVCSNCDAQFPKWSGRCSECGSWGTLSEEVHDKKEDIKKDTISKIGSADLIDLKKLIL